MESAVLPFVREGLHSDEFEERCHFREFQFDFTYIIVNLWTCPLNNNNIDNNNNFAGLLPR